MEKCKELAQIMMSKRHVLYIDETSFHKWQMKPRTWLRDNMTLAMPTERGSSVTVIGAIDNKDGLLHYKMLKGSNNGDVFIDFLNELKAKIKGRATLVMDNLPVHHSKKVMKHFDSEQLQAFFLPPYSCALNPIERLWAMIKASWRRHNMMTANQLEVEETVDEGVK